jgi:nucleotide-binding universal stress UspA family protein
MNLLVGSDFSPHSGFAVNRAAQLADQLGADLHLLHVIRPGEPGRALEESLRVASRRAEAWRETVKGRWSRRPHTDVRVGNVPRVVAETVGLLKPRLLVLGAHGRQGIAETFGSSIADRILQARTCPVLIVRREPRCPYGQVLVAMDHSATSTAALALTEQLLLTPGTVATVIHAFTPPYRGMLRYAGVGPVAEADHVEASRLTAMRAIRDVLKHTSSSPLRFRVRVEDSPAATAILDAAADSAADLVVMGTRGTGRVRRTLLGSVAHEVMQRTTCDLLIVPEPIARDAATGETSLPQLGFGAS